MSFDIFKLREKYGSCYFTVLENDKIPWRILSLGDFISYDSQIKEGRIPVSILENEIFKKCVLDEFYIINLDKLNAGTITTVARNILAISGPEKPQDINEDLNISRYNTRTFLHDGAGLICQTFPAYKVSDIMALPYKEYCDLLIMAEKRLLDIGFLKEPIAVTSLTEQVEPTQVQNVQPVQFKDLNPPQVKQVKPRNKEPVQENNKDFVVTGSARTLEQEIQMSLNGHDQQDLVLWKRDALEGLDLIYPELFKKMKEGEKITPETIRNTKGKTNQEVKENYKKYQEELLSGKINHKPAKPIIATGSREEGSRSKVRAKKRR
jgi:hypothetical protein